jgi:glycosyltransferase involved in cell wall biosynthesis
MPGPLVSIVTPTFNQAVFLRETVESVLAQDYPRIEHVVIDDGSTDETRTVLESFGTRVRWWSRPNRGQTPTINEGIDACRGEIVTWLNSDDTLLPGAVSWAVSALDRHAPAGVVFGDTLFTRADGSPLHRSTAQAFDYERFVVECHNPIPQCSSFISRRTIDSVGRLDSALYYFMDWDLWLRAGLTASTVYEPVLISTYRLHADSKTVSQSRRSAPELEYMYRKCFAGGGVPLAIRRRRGEALHVLHDGQLLPSRRRPEVRPANGVASCALAAHGPPPQQTAASARTLSAWRSSTGRQIPRAPRREPLIALL